MQNTPRTDDPQDQTVFIPPMNVASDPQLPPQNAGNPEPSGTNQSFFYTQDQEDDGDLALPAIDEQDDQGNQSAPFVLPFQTRQHCRRSLRRILMVRQEHHRQPYQAENHVAVRCNW